MQNETLFLNMDDGTEVFVRTWAEVQKPQAVLHIAHGMAEHSARYDRFAKFCNKLGLIVVVGDHRGHGQTGEKAGLMGYFAKENGFDRVVDDLLAINKWIQQKFAGLPIFLMGHSMGSFLTRRYLQEYGDTIKGAILMGSGGDPGFAAKAGRLLARFQMRKSATLPSKLLDQMAFGSFNKGIENPKTKFDWLTRDTAEVQKYIDDPKCGMICSSGFFFDLFTGLGQIHDSALVKQIPKEIPIFVVSGEADPVGKNGLSVRQFVGQLKNQGITNIELKLYPGARHELLNETNRDEVMKDLGQWLKTQLAQDKQKTP